MPETSLKSHHVEGFIDAKAEEETWVATREIFDAAQKSELKTKELFGLLSQKDSRGRFKAWGNDEFSREKKEEWIFEKDRLNVLEAVKESLFLAEHAPQNLEELERAKIDVLKEKITQLCTINLKFNPEAMMVLGENVLARAISELAQEWYPEEKEKDELGEEIMAIESIKGKIKERFNSFFRKKEESRYERLIELSKRFGWPLNPVSPENK